MDMTKKIRRNPDVMWREEDEALAGVQDSLDRGEVVEDVGTAVLFSGGTMLSINYLGLEIWKLCENRSLDEVVQELLSQFEVDESVLREDVQAFLDELSQKGFILYE